MKPFVQFHSDLLRFPGWLWSALRTGWLGLKAGVGVWSGGLFDEKQLVAAGKAQAILLLAVLDDDLAPAGEKLAA